MRGCTVLLTGDRRVSLNLLRHHPAITARRQWRQRCHVLVSRTKPPKTSATPYFPQHPKSRSPIRPVITSPPSSHSYPYALPCHHYPYAILRLPIPSSTAFLCLTAAIRMHASSSVPSNAKRRPPLHPYEVGGPCRHSSDPPSARSIIKASPNSTSVQPCPRWTALAHPATSPICSTPPVLPALAVRCEVTGSRHPSFSSSTCWGAIPTGRHHLYFSLKSSSPLSRAPCV